MSSTPYIRPAFKPRHEKQPNTRKSERSWATLPLPLYTASMLAHRAHFYIVITFTPEILPDESDNRLTIYCFLYLCILQPYHHRDEESEGEKK
ncbi:hypothetical protein BC936DRAFT_144839 [Jimgerdemannia flammicorona]|uniref:Uncharacterized protein n=1 Tax=Jimgerdemannia flammicorona TaxID=994334 RepID=A0A433DBJ9_9FUNG|nr:hypothetical protein BC936DRAFT_144839 [Jimgerdemannia flammicorona]